jgi:hypothetical protein
MNLPKNLGLILLGIWLAATGLLGLHVVHFSLDSQITGILAVAAGVLILIGR